MIYAKGPGQRSGQSSNWTDRHPYGIVSHLSEGAESKLNVHLPSIYAVLQFVPAADRPSPGFAFRPHKRQTAA